MGEVFAGRYELVDPIGRGGVGAVWRAWDHRRRRYVAAKVLQQSDAHALLRFVREQALRIDHPHVLAPASWAADDDKVLFTMDLVAGGSLVHLVNDYGPLPPSFVCTLTDQLLAGLAAVHAEGVVHRDIKPANVLLEATGTGRPRLRLSDFGIAMRLGEPRLTETNYVVGTPGYFAPEQMLGSDPDFPADLFAVGLVALYLLEGAKPDAKALIEYFADHGTPSAPRGIPEPLWQVVAMLLQPDPHARFRTATGARKALAAAVELLPEPGPDDELIEVFDQLGPLPEGFGPSGPLRPGGNATGGSRTLSSPGLPDTTAAAPGPDTDPSTGSSLGTFFGTGFGTGAGSRHGRGGPGAPGDLGDLGDLSDSGVSGFSEVSGVSGERSGSVPGPGVNNPGEPDELRESQEPHESVPGGVRSASGTGTGGLHGGTGSLHSGSGTGSVPPVPRPAGTEQRSARGGPEAGPAGDGTGPRARPGRTQAVAEPGDEQHVSPPAVPDGVDAPSALDGPATPSAPGGTDTPSASTSTPATTAPDATPRHPASRSHAPRSAPAAPPRPSSMSDTGSFHLPPPRPAATDPRRQHAAEPSGNTPSTHPWTPRRPDSPPDTLTPTPPTSVPLPPPASALLRPPPYDPTPTPTPTPTPPTAFLPTQVSSPEPTPVPPAAMPQHPYTPTASYTARSVQVPPASPGHRRRRARPRPGPPAVVAVPMLLLALACFAVGFWALAQV
ncbi:protein kinase domain-containing protein [Streptomyces aureus]